MSEWDGTYMYEEWTSEMELQHGDWLSLRESGANVHCVALERLNVPQKKERSCSQATELLRHGRREPG